MIALVNSDVVAAPAEQRENEARQTMGKYSPPMSAVLISPALITSKVALAILLAMESRLRKETVRLMRASRAKKHTQDV